MKALRDSLVVLAATILVMAPDVAAACSVCSAGRDDESAAAFIATTAFLSVLPLTLIGGFVWWIRRRGRTTEAASRSHDLAA